MTTVPKKTIPGPEEAKSKADHMKIAQHAVEQEKAGHYKLDTHVSQHKLADGGVLILSATVRHETNPSHAAEPHGLSLGHHA